MFGTAHQQYQDGDVNKLGIGSVTTTSKDLHEALSFLSDSLLPQGISVVFSPVSSHHDSPVLLDKDVGQLRDDAEYATHFRHNEHFSDIHERTDLPSLRKQGCDDLIATTNREASAYSAASEFDCHPELTMRKCVDSSTTKSTASCSSDWSDSFRIEQDEKDFKEDYEQENDTKRRKRNSKEPLSDDGFVLAAWECTAHLAAGVEELGLKDQLLRTTVYFGWINHPGTQRWRDIIQEFAYDFVVCPTCPKNIDHQVKERLQQEGIDRFMVCVDERSHPLRKIFNKNKECLGTWREATDEEFLYRTKQRFLDDRKKRKRSDAAVVSPHASEPAATLKFNRQQFYPITEMCVCFDWRSHTGTMKWCEVVKSFADDVQHYPQWNDDIVDLVKARLAEDDVIHFLAFLNSKGEATATIHDGLWYVATEEEITEKTRLQFLSHHKVSKDNGWSSNCSLSSSRSTLVGPNMMSSAILDEELLLNSDILEYDGDDDDEEDDDVDYWNDYFHPDEAAFWYDDVNEIGVLQDVEPSIMPEAIEFEDDASPDPIDISTGVDALLELSTKIPSHFPLSNVYFGWIKHPATKMWRNEVEQFSNNRTDFPNWTDDICDQVFARLQQKGISSYLVCRDLDGRPVKKIFNALGVCLGTWCPASDQEILDKIKQRFLNDRKRSSSQARSARSRGRPPRNPGALPVAALANDGAIKFEMFDRFIEEVAGCRHQGTQLVERNGKSCGSNERSPDEESNDTACFSFEKEGNVPYHDVMAK